MVTSQAILESDTDASTDNQCDDCLPKFPCWEAFHAGDAAFSDDPTAAERHNTTPLSEVGT